MKAKLSLHLAILLSIALIYLPLSAAAAQKMSPSNMSSSSNMRSQNKVMSSRNDAEQTVSKATALFNTGAENPSGFIPASVMKSAAGVAIFPGFFQAALLAGGSHGSGVLLSNEGNNRWSRPLFVSLSGGSLGAQVGVESSDLILVFRNRSVFDQVATGKSFTLGADASVAAGHMGKAASTTTVGAQILAYKRSSGLFAGAAVNGSVLSIDDEPTLAYYNLSAGQAGAHGYYGDKQLYNQIIGSKAKSQGSMKAQQTLEEPNSATNLRNAISNYISQAGNSRK
jgi:lipid-binding SYLF domain-containing protein